MKKLKFILLLFTIVCLRADEECDLMLEDVKDFIIEQRNNSDKNTTISKKDYVDISSSYNSLIDDIDKNEACTSITKDSIKINLKYYHGVYTVKRFGDVGSLKKMLSSSKKMIEDKISKNLKSFFGKQYNAENTSPPDYLESFDDRMVEAVNDEERNNIRYDVRELNNYFNDFNKNKIIPEIEELNSQYQDLNIFIDGKKYLEMQEFYDPESEKPIYITIEPPAIYYKKSKYKKYEGQKIRLEYLRKEAIPLKLTSYDIENGFYMKIPMLPIVQEKKKSGPEYSYAITVQGKKKYRFEFSLKNIEDVRFSSNLFGMQSKSDVPYNWSKIYLPVDYSWKYYDERNDVEVASYSVANGIYQDGYEDEFIAIKTEKNFIIYQRKDIEKSDYSLELGEKKSNFPSWVKYLLFLTLFGAGYGQS
jgi:hypothetical protein